MSSRFRIAVLLSILVAVTFSGGPSWHVSPVLASGPCDPIIDDPTPPIGPGEPDIVGTVTNTNTQMGIVGATMMLFVCTGSTASYVDSTTTNTSGNYVFSDLAAPNWYYVQAEVSGMLTPTGGTQNPSAAVDISDGATINFAFH
jgi:hypothetical protein